MGIQSSSKIVVVGAGTMGAGIAQVAAAAGHDVVVIDANPDGLARGRVTIAASLDALVLRGRLDQAERLLVEGRIHWSNALEAAAEADLVIEAIVERLDAKIALLVELTKIVGQGAILATNTSSLSIQALADAVDWPCRLLGLHFFNPVPVMKLVEVVPAADTDPDVITSMMRLMSAWKKRPVKVRDVPGFIVNRVARPYYAEGFAAWSEGMAPANVDHAMVVAGGFRMGPLALADMIGHDINFPVARSVYDAYDGRTRFYPQPSQKALFDAGRYGRKTGAGVFDYDVDLPEPDFAPKAPEPIRVRVSAHGGTSAKLFRASGLSVHDDSDLPYGVVVVDGVRIVVSDGRPLSARDDVDVLVDIARNFKIANTIVMTAREEASAAAAAGLVQATGRRALFMPDRAGMLVLRTLAQLANAAADAVADEVADASGVDEAMVYGANHPEGPLHWVDRAGRARVAEALGNIAEATGEAMYRPSPLLADATLGMR